MKRFFGIFMLVAAMAAGSVCGVQAADHDALWKKANEAYRAGDFDTAIESYNAIADDGYTSYKLYYNLGNAYFKNGQIGPSILAYNRALMLKPSDADTRHNLEIANGYVKVKIEEVPEFFMKRWTRGFRSMMGTNGWAVTSLLMLAIALAAALLYLLSEKLSRRKTGFYTGIVAIVLFLMALSFSIAERNEIKNSSDAIVMSASAAVKSSPDDASKDVFILYEGSKVKVLSTLGQWREIEIADGNKGWITEGAIENIR